MAHIDLTHGTGRVTINPADAVALHRAGVLVRDPRRERPRYFDGRFLAARDLIRDQQYFLTREADLGRASGSGVALGLQVREQGEALHITAGHGITAAGELVLLPQDMNLRLADIPMAEQLSARFGLGRLPVAPLRSRTGLYVLALRPVEFTANPIAAYPSTITGPRTVEDGDVIEATALILVPWNDDGAADALEARRSRAARHIFVQAQSRLVSSNVLPIAMLALQSNHLVWLDQAMVRRELGADRSDLPGLGFAPRALRLAHLLQHQEHLQDVVNQLHGRVFPAASQFQALPPAGPLPAGIIDTRDFTQRYFPAEVDVDFSIIPEDELPGLVEEALALPPIDFLASEAALDLTAVLVLAPVARADFRAVLAQLTRTGPRVRPLKAAAPNQLARAKPLEILQRLRLPLPLPAQDPANPVDAKWAELAKLPTLWFVRRRNLAYRDDLVGAPVAMAGTNEIRTEREVRARVSALGLDDSLKKLLANASSRAAASVLSLLATPRLAASPTLTAATLGALSAQAGSGKEAALDHAGALAVGAELAQPGVGDGLARLAQSAGDQVSKSALQSLSRNDSWRKLDSAALTATPERLPQLAARLTRIRTERKPATVAPAPKPSPAPAKAGSAKARAAASAGAAAGAGAGAAAGAGAGQGKAAAAAATTTKPARQAAAKPSPTKPAAAPKASRPRTRKASGSAP